MTAPHIRLVALVLTLVAATAFACTAPPATPSPKAAAATAAATQPPAAAATKAAAPSPTAAPAKPLTVALSSINPDINPYDAGLAHLYVKQALFESLVTMETGEATGALASSWRVVNPTTWEFTLRDARFSNGLPVTSDDVKFVIDRGLNPENRLQGVISTLAGVTGVEAPNPRTVVVTTRAVDPLVPNRFARVDFFPRRTFEEMGPERFNQAPVGTGPFKVRNFVPRQRIELIPNENYWGEKPRVSELIFREAAESTTRIGALQAGEVDVIMTVAPDQIARVESFGGRAVNSNIASVVNLFFDSTLPEFQDKRVRIGLNHAIETPTIIRTLLAGKATQAQGQPVTEGTFGYNPQVRAYASDLNRARQLLSEANFQGYTGRIWFQAQSPLFAEYAQAIASDLARVNVRLELSPLDNAQFSQRALVNQVGPIYLAQANSSILADPASALQPLLSTPPGIGRYNNPEFDRLFQQQASETDQARRRTILQSIMRVLNEDPPAVYLWGFPDFWAARQNIDAFEIMKNGLPPWNKVVVR